MSGFMHSLGQLFGRMVKALFLWAIIVGVVATAGFSIASHRLPTTDEWVLLGMLAAAAGAVGVLGTLVWELSHLGTISRAMRKHEVLHSNVRQP